MDVYSLTDNRLYFPAGSKRKYRVLLNNGILDRNTLLSVAVCRSRLDMTDTSNVISFEVDSDGQYFKMRNEGESESSNYLGPDAVSSRDLNWHASSESAFLWHNWGVGDQNFGSGLSTYLKTSSGLYMISGHQAGEDTFLMLGLGLHYDAVFSPVDNDGDQYQYDANGNMTSDNGESRSYNAGTNQMNSFAMTYDANGRVISYDKGAGQVNISYDKANGLFNSIAYEKTGELREHFIEMLGEELLKR